ncbi:MAG: DUF2269 family protein [Chloroflexota bacterium]|nr:DUF2269 family protein [Chloroflexota bacterium]
MFAAVATALGPELLLLGIGRSGDVHAIRAGYSLGHSLGRAIPILFVIGLVFGLLTVWTGGFNFFAPWLLIAYALFVVATVIGARIVAPHIARVAELAAQSPDDAPSPELVAALANRRADRLFALDVIIIIAFVFDMVVKPFS